jgi:hypothetical protein
MEPVIFFIEKFNFKDLKNKKKYWDVENNL